MEILNEQEQLAVQQFNENEVLKEAVRKVLLAGVYYNGTLLPGENAEPTRNFALSLVYQAQGTLDDAVIGAQLRADAEGIRIVENAWKKLGEYKQKKSTPAKKENPGL